MRRAKTLTGLAFQALRVRWAALGSGVKTLIIVSMVLAGAATLHFGACLLGGCPSSASPCNSPCSGAAQSDEPCPYSAARAEEAAAAQAATEPADDVPPCHRQ